MSTPTETIRMEGGPLDGAEVAIVLMEPIAEGRDVPQLTNAEGETVAVQGDYVFAAREGRWAGVFVGDPSSDPSSVDQGMLVVVALPEDPPDDLRGRLQGVIEAHPGAVPVVLVGAANTVLLPERWWVDTEAGVVVALSELGLDVFVRNRERTDDELTDPRDVHARRSDGYGGLRRAWDRVRGQERFTGDPPCEGDHAWGPWTETPRGNRTRRCESCGWGQSKIM